MRTRPLNEIADEIMEDWDSIPVPAADLLADMSMLEKPSDVTFDGTGRTVIAAFLRLATHWQTERSRFIKDELRAAFYSAA